MSKIQSTFTAMEGDKSLAQTAVLRLTSDEAIASVAYDRLRTQMQIPVRAYHTEQHIDAVLGRIYVWTDGQPSVSLIAAALYHDAIYDATRHDNELQSAVFCNDELTRLGVAIPDIILAGSLILETQYHQPHPQRRDEVLMVDADLHILGSSPTEYDAYVAAIREEYGHVSELDWRVGRKAVMERFLQRERIYWGDWEGRDLQEAAARANIIREIASLR